MQWIGRKNESRGNRNSKNIKQATRPGRRPAVESLEGRQLYSVSAGDLDAAFGIGGLAKASSTLSSISASHAAVQADGKVVVVGKSSDRVAVARFNANGTLDTSFGPSHTGIVLTTGASAATSAAIQSDGKIVVAAKDGGGYTFDVFRYLPNGSLDTSFGSGGRVHTDIQDLLGFFDTASGATATDVAIQPNGKIVVAGYADTSGFLTENHNDFVIVRYNANGSVDGSFGNNSGAEVIDFGQSEQANALAIGSNGTIVVAGTLTIPDNSKFSAIAVARLAPNGNLDHSFSGDGLLVSSLSSTTAVTGNGVVIGAGGNIVVAGTVTDFQSRAKDFAVAGFLSNGSPDLGFGTSSTGYQRTDFAGGNDSANAIIRSFDGGLIVGGASNGKFALAAYTADGKLDNRFNADGKLTTGVGETTAITGLAAAPGRRFIAVGSGSVFHAARYFDLVPAVNVGTFNPDAYERGTKSTSFLVTRTDRLPFATRVRLTLSGTARLKVIPVVKAAAAVATGATGATGVTGPVFGTGDYTLTGVGQDAQGFYVDIPAGQTFATVTVTPVDNGITNNSVKTAVFTVQSDNLYDVGTLSSVTINIHENDLPILHLPPVGTVTVGNKI
jgi:uncharacterized delta-60 repeat protein